MKKVIIAVFVLMLFCNVGFAATKVVAEKPIGSLSMVKYYIQQIEKHHSKKHHSKKHHSKKHHSKKKHHKKTTHKAI